MVCAGYNQQNKIIQYKTIIGVQKRRYKMVSITMGKIKNTWYAFQYGKKLFWSKDKNKLIKRIIKYKKFHLGSYLNDN